MCGTESCFKPPRPRLHYFVVVGVRVTPPSVSELALLVSFLTRGEFLVPFYFSVTPCIFLSPSAQLHFPVRTPPPPLQPQPRHPEAAGGRGQSQRSGHNRGHHAGHEQAGSQEPAQEGTSQVGSEPRRAQRREKTSRGRCCASSPLPEGVSAALGFPERLCQQPASCTLPWLLEQQMSLPRHVRHGSAAGARPLALPDLGCRSPAPSPHTSEGGCLLGALSSPRRLGSWDASASLLLLQEPGWHKAD